MDKGSNKPLVSVILPVKDGEKHLAQAIESILSQDYEPVEIIFIDGHSTDKTTKIAKGYPEVKYHLQNGKGVANAWNQGIGLAEGKFIAFQACDDLWESQKLSIQINCLLEEPDLGYNIGRVRFRLDEGESIPPGFRSELLEGDHVGRTLENMAARKSLFSRVGLFNEELDTGQDVDWFVRCKDQNVKMKVLPQLLLTKIIHQNNTTFNQDPTIGNRALLNIFRQSIKNQQKDQKES